MSNYLEQIRAFFHYTFKYAFNIEFGVRVAIEILILFIIAYFLLKLVTAIACKIAKILLVIADFIVYDVVSPIGIKLADFFEYKIGSPKWKLRSNNIKQKVLDHDGEEKDKKNQEKATSKKSYIKRYVVAFIILVVYIEFFHYCMTNVREYYPVFFIPEDIIVNSEYFLENIVFATNEEAIPSFYELIGESHA